MKSKVIGLILFVVLFFAGCRTDTISQFPDISEVNYNNYAATNYFDAYGEVVAYYGYNRLYVYDKGEKVGVVEEPVLNCKVVEGGVYYIAEETLRFFEIDTCSSFDIKETVHEFVIWNDILIFESAKSELLITKNSEELKKVENVWRFVVSNNNLYYIDTERNLFVIDLFAPADINKVAYIPPNVHFSKINVCGDKLVLDNETKFCVVDLKSKKISELPFPITEGNETEFICSDEAIYLTTIRMDLVATFPRYPKNKNNGVWKIDIETGEMEKISDEIFYQLYLFDDMLVGYNGNRGITIIEKDA